jgi:hypothetical protein
LVFEGVILEVEDNQKKYDEVRMLEGDRSGLANANGRALEKVR